MKDHNRDIRSPLNQLPHLLHSPRLILILELMRRYVQTILDVTSWVVIVPYVYYDIIFMRQFI